MVKTRKSKQEGKDPAFREVSSPSDFEAIAERYFREYLPSLSKVSSVTARRSGLGPDGGKDVVLTYRINTPIGDITQKLVVQAKLYSNCIGLSHFSDKTPPAIVAHRYHADIYIFVTSGALSETFKQCFDELDANPKHRCRFVAWDGKEFAYQIEQSGVEWMRQYAPKWAAKILAVRSGNQAMRKL